MSVRLGMQKQKKNALIDLKGISKPPYYGGHKDEDFNEVPPTEA